MGGERIGGTLRQLGAGSQDQLIAPLEAAHPDQSAFRLVDAGAEAFASRVQSARLALPIRITLALLILGVLILGVLTVFSHAASQG